MSLQLLYFAFDLAQPLFLSFLDQTFKMTLLHQFSMDWLGTWTVGSHICSLSTCTTRLYNITLFQVHFLAPTRHFPRSNSFTCCNMIQIVPTLWLHLLLDNIYVLKINCAPEMTIWFMTAVATRGCRSCQWSPCFVWGIRVNTTSVISVISCKGLCKTFVSARLNILF